MPDSVQEAHFSEVMPLSGPLPAPGDLSVEDARALLRSTTGTPHERIAAGVIVGVVGDERNPTVPRLVPVPGGEATIGLSPDRVRDVVDEWAVVGVEESWISKETPEHTVVIESFQLGEFPVSNGQYQAFLEESGWPTRPSTWTLGAYPWDRSNHPVAGVMLEDALAYCDWLSEREGLRCRLPTEHEWEYAARGPAYQEFPWGESFDRTAANTQEFGLGTTTPVGCFVRGRTWCGAWDMAGNVEELTSSSFVPYPGGPAIRDDLVELLGEYPVTRGGSFSRFGDLARCSRRHGPHPGKLYPCGFRIAAAAS